MPGDHIREKTDDQGERLGKDAHEFYRDHDRLNQERHGRVDDMPPVMFAGAEHDDNERQDTQHGGKGAVEGIARQPEAANDIRANMILAAALVEGVALLGAVAGLLAVFK